MGLRNLNTGAQRRTKLGLELEQSAKEILAHVKGDARLDYLRGVSCCRTRLMSSSSGPRRECRKGSLREPLCINPRTLQKWKKGRRKPDATLRAYLAVIAKNREAVLDALGSCT